MASAVEPDQILKEPHQTVKEPDQKVKEPHQTVKEPDQIVKEPHQTIKEPDQIDKEPHQTVKEPDQIIKEPHQTVKEPDQIIKEPHQTVNGSDQTVKEPDQIVKEPDQTVKEPDQAVKEPHQIVNEPDQTVKEPDGTLECCIYPVTKDKPFTGFRCVWKIENFTSKRAEENFEYFQAPELDMTLDRDSYWQLEFYPTGSKEYTQGNGMGFLLRYLRLKSYDNFNFGYVRFRIFNEEGVRLFIVHPSSTRAFNRAADYEFYAAPNCPEFQDYFVKNDSITIVVDGVVWLYEHYDPSVKTIERILENNEEKLLDAFDLMKPDAADLILVLNRTHEFPVVMSSLMKKSQYFEDKFGLNYRFYKENKGNFESRLYKMRMTTSMEPIEFQVVLHYIYTETVSQDFFGRAARVLQAAQYFQINGLINICDKYLKSERKRRGTTRT